MFIFYYSLTYINIVYLTSVILVFLNLIFLKVVFQSVIQKVFDTELNYLYTRCQYRIYRVVRLAAMQYISNGVEGGVWYFQSSTDIQGV